MKSFITMGPGLIGYNDLLKAGTLLNYSMRMLIIKRKPRDCIMQDSYKNSQQHLRNLDGTNRAIIN